MREREFREKAITKIRDTFTSIYGRRAGAAALAMTSPVLLFGGGYALAEHTGSGKPDTEESVQCPSANGMEGVLDGTGYRGQDEALVTVRLEDGGTMNLPTNTAFTVVDAERTMVTVGPDGESTSFSDLLVHIETEIETEKETKTGTEIEVETIVIERGAVSSSWTSLDEEYINSVTLCQG